MKGMLNAITMHLTIFCNCKIQKCITNHETNLRKIINHFFPDKNANYLQRRGNPLGEEVIDHEIWSEKNRGQFKISIIARLKGPWVFNVRYMVRLEHPKKETLDIMLSLDGFKELGELFIALHDFCKESIPVNETNIKKLKELLTSENIKNYVKFQRLKKKVVSVKAED
jgi:hypothetical protein